MSIREDIQTYGPARVYRNVDPDHAAFPTGTKPPYTYGLWFVHCPDCGHIGVDASAWWRDPESAAGRAIRHNRLH